MSHRDGVIKFRCCLRKSAPPLTQEIQNLQQWRQKLFGLNLIGEYPDTGIGFGNISARSKGQEFIITGTQTGGLHTLGPHHYTCVTDFNIEDNALTCEGEIQASSEALTHAALYVVDSPINAVVHVHHAGLWKEFLGKLPTSSPDVPYGTPEMAKEIFRLYAESPLQKEQILIMGGHEEGILTFGRDLEEAGEVLLKLAGRHCQLAVAPVHSTM